MSDRQQRRDSLIEEIIGLVTREIDSALNDTEMSSRARDKMTDELMANTRRILDACSTDELYSSGALEAHIRSCIHNLDRRRVRTEEPSLLF